MTLDEQINFLTRGCVDVVSKADLAKKLESGKTLKVKLGCDPTSADLHLGHSVALSLLRRFQDLGLRPRLYPPRLAARKDFGKRQNLYRTSL